MVKAHTVLPLQKQFMTALTTGRHRLPSKTTRIQSTPSHYAGTYLALFLILYSQARTVNLSRVVL